MNVKIKKTLTVPIGAVGNDYHVIARSEATWQSPGTIHRIALQKHLLYREIATPLRPQARAERNRRIAAALSASQCAHWLAMTW